MKLDDFEAVFRSSVKKRFQLEAPELTSIMLLTDLPLDDAGDLEERVKKFLSSTLTVDELEWHTVRQDDFGRVGEMIQLVASERPDMIVSYRHLLGRDKDLRYSLGSFIDSVTQATEFPVLLLPPLASDGFDKRMSDGIESVLVVTDHIIGDETLVNWGLLMCPWKGKVILAHVEDDATYKRYMDIIAMIPDAHTETTAERIKKKLLGRPRDYIGSIVEALEEAGIEETVEPLVTMGHSLTDYKRIIEEHDVDLLVCNTKDENQLAMHGMAYSIAVEIQDRPILLL